MKLINIIKVLGIITSLFLLPSISNAQIQRVWNIAEYTSTMLPPPLTGTKVAYRTINNSLYYWNGTAWVRIAGPGIVDTSYSLSFSSPNLSLLGSGSSVSLTNLYTAGYGLIKTGEAWRADTTSPNGLATRLFAKTLPTNIAANYIATSNGTNLVARNLFDNNTYIGVLNSKPWIFGSQSVAGLPVGVDGYWLDVSDHKWIGRYNSTAGAWIYPTQDSRAGGLGSVNGAIHFNTSAFKTTESSTFTQLSNKLTLGVPSGKNPMVDIVVGTGDGTVNEAAGFRLRNRTNDGNTFYLQMGTSTVAAGGSNQGFAYMQSGLWGGNYTNPFFINPKGGFVGFGAVASAEWEVSVKNAIGINAPAFPPALGQGGRLVFSTNKGLNAPAQIVAWYDQANWFQGTGLVFKTESGADVSGAANQGIERMRISSDGNVGIGKTPVYLLDVGGTNATAFPRGTVAQRPTIIASTSPMRYNTDSTAFEYGESVGTWRQIATRAYARSLVAGLPTTWLKTELEAGRDVNIAGASSTDLRIQNSRIQFDGRVKFGIDSVFTYDPIQDTFFIGGNGKFGKQPSDDSFIDYSFRNLSSNSTAVLIESGRTSPTSGTAELVLRPSGNGRGAISYGNIVGGNQLGFFSSAKADLFAANTEGILGLSIGGEQWVWHYVNDDADPDTAMTLNTIDDQAYLRLYDYGNGAINSALLGEYPGKYIPAITTTGKILEYRLARDTFIEDVTLFSVGTMMYDCQELTVVSSMTNLAPTHQEIRFPDAAEGYRGKKIIVTSRRKDVSIYVPQIKVVGGASRLYFTTTPGIGGADPSDQSILSLDDSTWPEIGTYEFTCLKINSTDYRWVLKQR